MVYVLKCVMGSVKSPDPALVLLGLIHGPDFKVSEIMPAVTARLGPLAMQSDPVVFDQTDYYHAEMGVDLIRHWWIFEKPVMPDTLSGLKIWSNELEQQHLNPTAGRRVNLDPGIITLSNLILASTKNYSHRIYLSHGIYAEVTLIYRHGQFQPLAWTYPDYKTAATLAFFTKGREWLKKMISR